MRVFASHVKATILGALAVQVDPIHRSMCGCWACSENWQSKWTLRVVLLTKSSLCSLESGHSMLIPENSAAKQVQCKQSNRMHPSSSGGSGSLEWGLRVSRGLWALEFEPEVSSPITHRGSGISASRAWQSGGTCASIMYSPGLVFVYLGAPSIQTIPTLGTKLHKDDLLWAIWSLRVNLATELVSVCRQLRVLPHEGRACKTSCPDRSPCQARHTV